MPPINMPVQRLKVAILPLDFPCSGPVTHSGEILTNGKSHGKTFEETWIRETGTGQQVAQLHGRYMIMMMMMMMMNPHLSMGVTVIIPSVCTKRSSLASDHYLIL